jgi:4-hydroxybenzoate polyprenyltransferase/phosphoserine phosphatase
VDYFKFGEKLMPCKTKIIVVDLDGTLVLIDTLHESVIQVLHDSPLSVLHFPLWLSKGKAYLKAQISDLVALNPASLPYNEEVIAWLKQKKAAGHLLVLCSATDRRIAEAIASHLDLFDQVIASDGYINIAGDNKRDALDQAFGAGNYAYAGNSSADIAVWQGAREAIVVNANNKVLKQAETVSEVSMVIPPVPRTQSVWLRVLRVHQWLKNLLLFLPILAAHLISHFPALATLLLAFMSFCAGASAIYIINDLLDLESDRQHPHKRHRPFASGAVPILYGALLAPCLGALSFILAWTVGAAFFGCLFTYLVLATLYSFSLKRYALIDCLTLAGLYTLRIIAGAAAVGVVLSFWLLAFSIFIFLSLAFVKRYAELQAQAGYGKSVAHGRGYKVSDAPLIQNLGVTSGYTSVLVLALYLNSDIVVSLYTQPEIIWLAVPLMLFWVSWVWLKAHHGQMHDDPIIFALKDRASLIVGLLLAAIFISATLLGTA